MSVTLRQLHQADQRIDLRGVLPANLAGLNAQEIGAMPLHLGNRRHPLSELFAVEIDTRDTDLLTVVPADGRIDYIGAGLQGGRIEVTGDAGDLLGAGMTGGGIRVSGNVGDNAGSAMRAGELQIDGNAGNSLGGPVGGGRLGQQGGLIRVLGTVGECAGERMRRGMLLIDGDGGDRLGHRMIAGTVYCGGRTGVLTGYAMRRGTLILRRAPGSLPSTFADNGRQPLPFLALLRRELARLTHGQSDLGDSMADVQRYVGDLAYDGHGEILILD